MSMISYSNSSKKNIFNPICKHEFNCQTFMERLKKNETYLYNCFERNCISKISDFDIQNVLDKNKYKEFETILTENDKIERPECYWICNICTCKNLPHIKFCVACQSNRPELYIPPHYYAASKEEKDALAAEECRMKEEKREEKKNEIQDKDKKIKMRKKEDKVTKCSKCRLACGAITLHSCLHTICSQTFVGRFKKNETYLYNCLERNCTSKISDFDIQTVLDKNKYKEFETILTENDKIERPECYWICNICTCKNLPHIKFCVACQSNRPESYIPPLFYTASKEEKDALAAEECRTKEEKEIKEKEEKEREDWLNNLKSLTKQGVTMTNEVSECPICMMEYGAGEAIILHSCLHTICKDCFKNYLLNTVEPKIKCPTENCIGQIEDQEISKMLNESQYEQYEQLSLRKAEAAEEFSFHCKGVNCTAWIVHDGMLKNFKCPLCKKENCINCEAIHENISCEEYERSKQSQPTTSDELYFEKLLKHGEAMICSGCKAIVEKTQGCDWIKCCFCRTELCWATKGPRWGPRGNGDTSGGCRCRIDKKKCHPSCRYCH